MPSSSPLCGPTRMLIAISALMLQVVMQDRLAEPAVEWGHLVLAVAIAFFVGRTQRGGREEQRNVRGAVGVLILFVMPFLSDLVQRAVSSWGSPFEIQLVLGLRNMMFGLAASRDNERALKFATLASCFTALYSILWLMNTWNIALMLLYTIVGMWWLASAYWARISDCFLARSERAVPWKPIGATAILSLVVLALLMPLATGTSYTTAINGFLPSSGGTRWQDEHAWGGIGDGMQLVSAKEDASSFAPIESELFLESKMPSLYDCFNEFAEPPPKPEKKKKHNRAIPLSPSQMKQNHRRRGMNQKAGREFDTVRKRKSQRETPQLDDIRSAELLQVVGRVPVHLGLYAYDLWDGHQLRSSDSSPPLSLYLERRPSGKNWVRSAGLIENKVFTHREQHELRIINLKTDRLPATPSLIGASIDQIHTETLFESTQDGMLALDVEFIPQLSVMHVESLYRNLMAHPLPVIDASQAVDPQDPLLRLAQQWTRGIPEGWPQVEAICRRLKSGYELDPDAMVPSDVDDTAVYFLEESKRGPDYLFAASAATLLRRLGYETRVVSGFYVDPEHYDRQARVTTVYADDAHFWVEVLATCKPDDSDALVKQPRNWIPIDPSPGYDVLHAPESFWSMLLARSALTWQAIKRSPIQCLVVVAIGLLVWWQWAALGDFCVTSWWRLRFPFGDARERVLSTLCLLERRARLYGRPRAIATPLGRWDLLTANRHTWGPQFVTLADRALYGDGFAADHAVEEVRTVCRTAVFAFHLPKKRLPAVVNSRTTQDDD